MAKRRVGRVAWVKGGEREREEVGRVLRGVWKRGVGGQGDGKAAREKGWVGRGVNLVLNRSDLQLKVQYPVFWVPVPPFNQRKRNQGLNSEQNVMSYDLPVPLVLCSCCWS